MTIQFEVIEDPPADHKLWKQWENLVYAQGWTSDDHSAMGLTPGFPTTKSVFAVTPGDHDFIGTVIWNEQDNIAFVGFFLLSPEHRGKGCGIQIWRRAMSRIPDDHLLGLRGVPAMVEKYKTLSVPVEGATLAKFVMNVEDFHAAMAKEVCETYTSKFVSDLSEPEWAALLDYDLHVTGRDRKLFLEKYHNLDITTTLVFFDADHNIIGQISCVPTLFPKDNTIKVSPLFANSDQIALAAQKQFSTVLQEKYPTAKLVFNILDVGKGKMLKEFFGKFGVVAGVTGVTLFGSEIPKFGDLTKVYMPHNNPVHYDY